MRRIYPTHAELIILQAEWGSDPKISNVTGIGRRTILKLRHAYGIRAVSQGAMDSWDMIPRQLKTDASIVERYDGQLYDKPSTWVLVCGVS